MLTSVPGLVLAQPIQGLYFGAGAGVNFLQNERIKASSLPGPVGGVHTSYQQGWAGVGSIGYGFGNGWRAEMEGNYRTNHQRSDNPVYGSSSAAEQKYGVMLNGLYDFDLSAMSWNSYGVTPYLGLGAGMLRNQWNGQSIRDGAGRVRTASAQNSFAFQGIAGIAYPVASVPGLAVTLEYRLVDEPISRKYGSAYVAPGINFATQTKAGGDLNHSILLGVRYALNTPTPVAVAAVVPAPAPVVAPAPALSRSYLLFFDWDRADLSERARQIILDASQNATHIQYTHIDVQGHADLSGTHAYNQGLSLRRANAVAMELVRDGVPETAIVITALGDTKPLVETPPGVREPQNRRVEIVIQ